MKYFYDTEFLEGAQRKRLLGIPYGRTKPTIDLISIGIVSDAGQEYYAVNREFNLKEAWNRHDFLEQTPFEKYHGFSGRKYYWIRENVLRSIFDDWKSGLEFNYRNFKKLLHKYGKTTEQIKQDIQVFVYRNECIEFRLNSEGFSFNDIVAVKTPISFYGYYSAYDHVALCWLFGKMIDLPKGFPMYTNDLKQMMDSGAMLEVDISNLPTGNVEDFLNTLKKIGQIEDPDRSKKLKQHPDFPRQVNEHNALADARWNKKLYEFLKKL